MQRVAAPAPTGRPAGRRPAADLDERCLESETVGRFERPREYRFVDESLPRTATGILDRATVRSDLNDAPDRG